MGTNERILELVKQKGPILPVQISKEINDNILMTSARLAELLSNKQIMVSNVKIGGSPLYYFQGQESKLQDFSDNLVDKEKEAYNLLQQKKVLRDTTQQPPIRVALRQIRDFAVPLQVKFQDNTEIFWKWYLTGNNEAQLMIKEVLAKKEIKPETGTKIEKQKQEVVEEEQQKTEENKEGVKEKEETKPAQKEKTKTKKTDKTLFLKQINGFFDKNDIKIVETDEIKKNSEINFIVELETSIGNVRYFCKSRNKKKINDADLSSALVQAQSKNLPLLFLTKGKIVKKAEEKLKTDLKNVVYREI